MSLRTASESIPDDVPQGIDITQSKYLFGKVEWDVAPVISCTTSTQKAHLARREAQDDLYRTVGNPITWDLYISIGYFTYDDCFHFETQWMKMCRHLTAKYKFIWFSYLYHTKRFLATANTLEAWALDIARPYLLKNLPDGYEPDTTDPRTGRFDESYDDMEIEDRKPAAIPADNDAGAAGGWTLMSANGKPVRPTSQIPSSSPVATTALLHHEFASYPAVHHPSASAAPSPAPTPNPMPPPALLHQPSVTRRDAKFSTHNDGTLRITVRWSPIEYDALKPTTSNSWVNNATDILHFLLITAPTCFFSHLGSEGSSTDPTDDFFKSGQPPSVYISKDCGNRFENYICLWYSSQHVLGRISGPMDQQPSNPGSSVQTSFGRKHL